MDQHYNRNLALRLITIALIMIGVILYAHSTPAQSTGNPLPRHFQLDIGTGVPRTHFRAPYTAEECTTSITDGTVLARCFPQLYVYP